MAAYVVLDMEITDLEGFKEYQEHAGAVIERYGGKHLVRGGTLEVLEGDWQFHRLVILEFESVEQVMRFYNSEEYTPLKALRLKTTNSREFVVQGL